MTYTDETLNVADGFSLVGVAGVFIPPVADVVDLAAFDLDGSTVLSKPDFGIGDEINVQVAPGTALNVVASITAEVVIAENTALTTNAIVLASTGSLTLAQWNDAAAHPFILRVQPNPQLTNMDPNDATSKRYLGMRFTTVTGTSTTGTVNARIVTDFQPPTRYYPTKYEVL